MKKLIIFGAISVVLVGLIVAWGSIRQVIAQIDEVIYGDSDMLPRGSEISEEEFLLKRSESIAQKRGVEKNKPFDPWKRIAAIRQLEQQETRRLDLSDSRYKNDLLAAWTEIGPNPIPNGQVYSGPQLPASGRTISIAVHPTDPNIVYVGTAQGGLYRTTDGGTTWTPLLDNALSLAVNTVAIAPSQPNTIFVGTGEAGFGGGTYFGVGIYRIDNAATTNPIVTGPIAGNLFTGRSVGKIVVHPTNANIIFATSAAGFGGIYSDVNNVLAPRGVFRSTDALSANPSFTKLSIGALGLQNRPFFDMVIDPGNPNLLLCSEVDVLNAGEGGIYRSTDALSANPTFTRTFIAGTGFRESRTEMALQRNGGVVTVYAASAFNGGTVQRSTDGGATFTQQIDNNFCQDQCFYNIGIDVDPTNADRVYLGGTGSSTTFGFSSNGGLDFTSSQSGLHGDTQAIAVAPSLSSTIYLGSDGGIYKSTNNGLNWSSLNNSTFRATQFMSIAVHPTDPNFSVGGTQDNGTLYYLPDTTWYRVDYGDGGNALFDQNSTDTENFTLYHTYYNLTNAMGFARVVPGDTDWHRYGCGFSGFIPNGMTCSASAAQFYAPLEQGPGNPNTLYFGSDVLYRSSNSGVTMTKVSQEPITNGVSIDAIGISPQDDNVRIAGLENGGLFGTTTGSTTLTNLDAGNIVPDKFIARTVIDPNNTGTAYVTIATFGVVNVWKTTNLSDANPGWISAAGGLPLVPVNAFVIDTLNSRQMYAGTDIGVYTSSDAGLSWVPFGTGLPRVAVFDMAITSTRLLRIATYGRGMWQTGLVAAPPVTVSGRVTVPNGAGLRNAIVTLTDSNAVAVKAISTSFGYFSFDSVPVGATYTATITSKRYSFTPRTLTVSGAVSDFDFVGSE